MKRSECHTSEPESHIPSLVKGKQQPHAALHWAWLEFLVTGPQPPLCLAFQHFSFLSCPAGSKWNREMEVSLGPCCLITFGSGLIWGTLGASLPYCCCSAGRRMGCVVRRDSDLNAAATHSGWVGHPSLCFLICRTDPSFFFFFF